MDWQPCPGSCPNLSYRLLERSRNLSFFAGFPKDFKGSRKNHLRSRAANGQKENYPYDGSDIIQESGAKSASYTYGTGVDEPLVRNSGSLKEYYHADILGSFVALSDASGAIQTSYDYSPYGKKVTPGTTSDNPLKLLDTMSM